MILFKIFLTSNKQIFEKKSLRFRNYGFEILSNHKFITNLREQIEINIMQLNCENRNNYFKIKISHHLLNTFLDYMFLHSWVEHTEIIYFIFFLYTLSIMYAYVKVQCLCLFRLTKNIRKNSFVVFLPYDELIMEGLQFWILWYFCKHTN